MSAEQEVDDVLEVVENVPSQEEANGSIVLAAQEVHNLLSAM